MLFQTTNGAASWAPTSTVGVNGWNPSGNNVDAIGLAASNASTIYAATGGNFASSSNIYVTTNGGTSWTNINLPAGSGRVNDLEVDPTNSQIVYAVVSTFGGGHVFQSINGGTTWTNISGNLPNLPTWSLQIDPSSGALYVGNDTGVYVSTNTGTSWSPLGTGLPNAQVFQIALNTNYHTLAAGTHGRGMWEILTQGVATATTTTLTSSVNPSILGQSVTFTATVTHAPGTTTPTGTVKFFVDGSTTPADTEPVNGSGQASFPTSSLSVGTHSITAVYGGDTNFNGSTSAALIQNVGYSIVPQYDQTQAKNAGSTIPIKIEATDSSGNDVSSASLTVTATAISGPTGIITSVPFAGNSNPNDIFRFASGGYMFNLKTTGLASGTYLLYFTIQGDPTPHSVQFVIK